jgi:N-acetylglucosamine-6-phosphate deacetylase
MLNLSVEEAARMASTYPAQFLEVADERGRIAVGLRADLVELDDDLNVQRVWVGGQPHSS